MYRFEVSTPPTNDLALLDAGAFADIEMTCLFLTKGIWMVKEDALTYWGRMMHICISKLTIIGSDNDLAPGQHQAIILTNARILLIWTLGTNFSEILSKTHAFSFKKMHLKMLSAKWGPFCLGLNVLNRMFQHLMLPDHQQAQCCIQSMTINYYFSLVWIFHIHFHWLHTQQHKHTHTSDQYGIFLRRGSL